MDYHKKNNTGQYHKKRAKNEDLGNPNFSFLTLHSLFKKCCLGPPRKKHQSQVEPYTTCFFCHERERSAAGSKAF